MTDLTPWWFDGMVKERLAERPVTALDLRPIEMAAPGTPADPGPYYVGYGDDWRKFDAWDEAWTHHVMRGSTVGCSHIKVAT